MIAIIIIYLLIGIVLVSFCMGFGISQTDNFNMNNVRWFNLFIFILLYPIVFLILIVETIGERIGRKYK